MGRGTLGIVILTSPWLERACPTRRRRSTGLLRPAPRTVFAEAGEEPARPDSLGSEGLGPFAEVPVGRDEDNSSAGALGNDFEECLVPRSPSVEDHDSGSWPGRDAGTSLTLQNHRERLSDPSAGDCFLELIEEGTGSGRPIPPPTVRTRADDIGRIDEHFCRRNLAYVEHESNGSASIRP